MSLQVAVEPSSRTRRADHPQDVLAHDIDRRRPTEPSGRLSRTGVLPERRSRGRASRSGDVVSEDELSDAESRGREPLPGVVRGVEVHGGVSRRVALPDRVEGDDHHSSVGLSTLLASVRSIAVTASVVAVVAFLAAEFAHLFRTAVEAGASLLVGSAHGEATGFRVPTIAALATIALGLLLAGAIGRRASRASGDRLGLASVAAAVRGEGDVPRLRPTLMRAGGNLFATAAQSSLGRETPILETGGSIGAVAGRLTGRSPAHLAAAGIAAGFAAAYHAPIAAVLYVEEHLRVRHDRRALLHTVAGAALGFTVLRLFVQGDAILPAAGQPLGGSIAVLALVGLVPALIASRCFLRWRELAAARSAVTAGGRTSTWARWVLLACASAALVALVPLTAGNGMGAMRYASTHPTLQVALALAVVKLLATTTAIGSGAPGGVFSPSLAVAGGAALLTFHALEAVGLALPGSSWDGMLVAMSVGIAVSIRSPLVATVVVAEMCGDLRLVPISAAVVLAATLLDRGLDRRRAARGDRGPVDLHDEDA